MKYLKVRIAVGTSDSTFDIYYNSVNSSTRALLYNTGLPAIGLTNEILETGEGVTVSVPDEATSIILDSNPAAFCSEVNGVNNNTFSIPLGCMSYTVSSSAGVFNYFYTDCDCFSVSATLDATDRYTEKTFCALQDSVNSGFLTIVDNGGCSVSPSPTPTHTPTPTPTNTQVFTHGLQQSGSYCIGGFCYLYGTINNIIVYSLDEELNDGSYIYINQELTIPYTIELVSDGLYIFNVSGLGQLSLSCIVGDYC